MGKNYIVNRILLGQISRQAWHGVVSKILTCNICRIKNESVLRSNTYMLKNMHSHFLLYLCMLWLCNTWSHDNIIPLFRKLIGSFVHFFTLQDEYTYWNSELKKSRKRKPTKHRKDKVLLIILVYKELGKYMKYSSFHVSSIKLFQLRFQVQDQALAESTTAEEKKPIKKK